MSVCSEVYFEIIYHDYLVAPPYAPRSIFVFKVVHDQNLKEFAIMLPEIYRKCSHRFF